jgi:hypothetical protein
MVVVAKAVEVGNVLDGFVPSLEGGGPPIPMSAFIVFDTKQESVSKLASEHLFMNSNIGLNPSIPPVPEVLSEGLSAQVFPAAFEMITPKRTAWVIQEFIFDG